MGQATAQMNVSDLRKALGLPVDDLSPSSLELVSALSNQPSPGLRRYRVRRQSMEQLDLIKVRYPFLFPLPKMPIVWICSLTCTLMWVVRCTACVDAINNKLQN